MKIYLSKSLWYRNGWRNWT